MNSCVQVRPPHPAHPVFVLNAFVGLCACPSKTHRLCSVINCAPLQTLLIPNKLPQWWVGSAPHRSGTIYLELDFHGSAN